MASSHSPPVANLGTRSFLTWATPSWLPTHVWGELWCAGWDLVKMCHLSPSWSRMKPSWSHCHFSWCNLLKKTPAGPGSKRSRRLSDKRRKQWEGLLWHAVVAELVEGVPQRVEPWIASRWQPKKGIAKLVRRPSYPISWVSWPPFWVFLSAHFPRLLLQPHGCISAKQPYKWLSNCVP